MVMLVIALQPANELTMSVMLFGIVMLVRLLQPSNAYHHMYVTLSGIIMLVRPLRPLNALGPMLVTLPSSGITLLLAPHISIFLLVSIRQLPVL